MALNGVKAPVTEGSLDASSTMPRAAACKACGPRPPVSRSISLKPPPVPMPRTEGGGITITRAALMGASLARMAPSMAGPSRPSLARAPKSLNMVKMTAVLGADVNVAPSVPTKAAVWATPGWLIRRAVASCTTSLVRARVEPAGSWIETMA